MRNNAIFSARQIRRAAALLLAAFMLTAAAVSCRKAPNTITHSVSRDTSVFEDAETEKALERFLDVFSKWYAASPHGEWNYDSARAASGSGNILACIAASNACVDWALYSDTTFEDRFVEKANDPRGWASETNSYYVFDAKTVEFIAREIFNVSDPDIEKLVLKGDLNRQFYRQNGSYYSLSDDNRRSLVDVSSVSVEPRGNRYSVHFIVSGVYEKNDEGTVRVVYRVCTAEMALKNIGGNEFWSLYQFESVES